MAKTPEEILADKQMMLRDMMCKREVRQKRDAEIKARILEETRRAQSQPKPESKPVVAVRTREEHTFVRSWTPYKIKHPRKRLADDE